MTTNEYLWAWGAYYGAAGFFFAVLWYWTRRFLWAEARQLIRVILGVVLVVPWFTAADSSYMAPAWIISIAELLLEGAPAFWRAGLPLVLSLVAAIVLSTLCAMYRWNAQRRANKSEQDKEIPSTAL